MHSRGSIYFNYELEIELLRFYRSFVEDLYIVNVRGTERQNGIDISCRQVTKEYKIDATFQRPSVKWMPKLNSSFVCPLTKGQKPAVSPITKFLFDSFLSNVDSTVQDFVVVLDLLV